MGLYAPWTPVEAEIDAHEDLVYSAMCGKVKKHPPGGVMVLAGEGPADFAMPVGVVEAFAKIPHVPGAEKWTFVFISRWNHIGYYSAIFSPTIAFEERHPPPPDPEQAKKFFRNADGSLIDYNKEMP